ncbi:MAG: indolepyruvate oxidoreductase subunit beta [Lentisphaerota bacterium]
MDKSCVSNPTGVVVAGVGGQGVITLSQLILGAAWKSGYFAIQSEVHGMSQRGGSVNAQIIFDKVEVSSPTILEGTASLIIGMEPLEALRYFNLLRKDASVICSTSPVRNMPIYPNLDMLIAELKKIDGTFLVDTDKISEELESKGAGNMVLLGAASKKLPFTEVIWHQTIKDRFAGKEQSIIDKNIEAFNHGKKLYSM